MIKEMNLIAEVDASELFNDGDGGWSNNWYFCADEASLSHEDKGGCAFIIDMGNPCPAHCDESQDYYEEMLERMEGYGCSERFVETYKEARRLGATRVLFYT